MDVHFILINKNNLTPNKLWKLNLKRLLCKNNYKMAANENKCQNIVSQIEGLEWHIEKLTSK